MAVGRWEAPAQQQNFSRHQHTTEGKNNNNINFLKAFILFFFLSPPHLFRASAVELTLCVCASPCKDPPAATRDVFLQKQLARRWAAFLEGNAQAHTHLNSTESKNELNFQAHVGKTSFAGFFWGCHGIKVGSNPAGIINVDTWMRCFGLVRKKCNPKGKTA